MPVTNKFLDLGDGWPLPGRQWGKTDDRSA